MKNGFVGGRLLFSAVSWMSYVHSTCNTCIWEQKDAVHKPCYGRFLCTNSIGDLIQAKKNMAIWSKCSFKTTTMTKYSCGQFKLRSTPRCWPTWSISERLTRFADCGPIPDQKQTRVFWVAARINYHVISLTSLEKTSAQCCGILHANILKLFFFCVSFLKCHPANL